MKTPADARSVKNPADASAATSRCRECREGLEHCHGTLIHHAWHRPECTEDNCTTPEVVHAFSVDCEALGCTCAAVASAHRVG